MLKYGQDKIGIKFKDVIIGIITVIIAVIGLKIYYDRYISLLDFGINRTVCGYVLHGINPMNIIGKGAIIPEVGSVDYPFGNMPYGLFLGNLFYFGFLPFNSALTAFMVETVVLMIITMVVANKYFDKHLEEVLACKAKFYFNLFTIVSANILGPVRIGNNGHMLCMLLTIAIFMVDDHKIISGICIALAMIKPQIAVPVCIAMLLYKKFTPLFVGALIDIFASCIVAGLLKENVVQLFIDSLKLNNNLVAIPYFGIFSIFRMTKAETTTIYSMIFGIILVILCCILLKKDVPNIFKFFPPLVITCFWSYGWSSDHYIIELPAVVCMILYYYIEFNENNNDLLLKHKKLLKIFYLITALCFHFHWFLKAGLRQFFLVIDPFQWHYDHFKCKTISNTIIYSAFIIVMFVTIYVINKINYKEISDQ